NFTFYYFYPQTGDEFRQHESRNLMGYNSKISHQTFLKNGTLTSTASMGIRNDDMSPSYLAHTINGSTILNYIQLGKIHEINLNGYIDETYETGNWLFNAAVRVDYLHFYYLNLAPASDTSAAIYNGVNPTAQKAIVSPKFSVQYAVNPQMQFYIKTGKGFHSNDARIVIANRGYEILPAAYGADFGVNWKPVPNLFINTALWYLYLQQEFTYGADLGDQAVLPGGKTKREGIDFSIRYQFNHWLYGFMNIDLDKPRSIGAPKGEDYLPLAPTFTSTGGLDVKFSNGINGSINYRYMHNRAANDNYSLTALGYWVTDLTLNYTRKKYEVGIAIENLFNVTWNESQFAYTSRLKNETQPVDEVSYTPGTPFFAKLKFSIFF
ncbi:MAG TPA: TonB-dependent receptor, partial [Puia sp.]